MTAWVALAGWVVAGPALGLAAPPPPDAAAPVPELAPPPAAASKASPPAAEGAVTAPLPLEAPTEPEPSVEDGVGDAGEAIDEPPEVAAPAPLPPEGPPPPKPSEPRAWGGALGAPLPQPPAAADPSTLEPTPWRGRVWLGVGLGASIPLGGRPPAAGGVVAFAAELDLGWRLSRFLALHTSVSSFAHDAARRTQAAPDGIPVSEVELGRITAFDLVTARVFAPVHRRIEPWAEVGLGVGSRRGPFAVDRQAVGLVRVGAGVDFWLAPTLTLGASAVYRTIILGDAIGHGLRAGAELGIHW